MPASATPRRPATASVPRPGALVWAYSSTEHDIGVAAQDGVDVHFVAASCRGTRRSFIGTTSRSAICSAVSARPWVSTTPMTTSVPRAPRRRPRRASCRSCRRPARRPDICAACLGPWLSYHAVLAVMAPVIEREVQLDDVDAGLAEHAELAPVGVLADERSTTARRRGRARSATRRACSRALATEMCGIQTRPRCR